MRVPQRRNILRGGALGGRNQEVAMTFGKGLLLWILGIPLPIILLLALFWR